MPFDDWRLVGIKPVGPLSIAFPYSVLGELKLVPPTSTSVAPNFSSEYVTVQWNNLNDNARGSWIERRAGQYGEGSFYEIDEVDRYITSYDDLSLAQFMGSQTYFYRIRPFNENQENADHGPEVSFRNIPNSPAGVSAYALTRSIGEGGGPSQRIQVQWSYPQNQLANSIQYYKAKVEYPNHSGVVEWKDSLYGTSTEFCATYWNEPANITMYAVSNWDELGRAAAVVQVQAGGYEAGCYVAQDPPGGRQNSTPPPGGELGKPALPTEFALSQNFPNPFNPNTSITVSIAEPSALKLTIINALGQQIRTVYDGSVTVGHHEFIWDGRDEHGNSVGSGLYFYRAEAGEHVATRKMILLK